MQIDVDKMNERRSESDLAQLSRAVNEAIDGTASLEPEFFKYDLYKHGLTQSLMGKFLDCERKFRLSTMGLTGTGTSGAIIFGNVYHTALELIQNRIQEGSLSTPESVADEAELICSTDLPAIFEEEYNNADPDAKQHYEFAFGVSQVMVPVYFDFWKQDFFGDTKKDWMFAEEEFTSSIAGVPIRGKMDGAFRMNGKVWLFEHKTKGQWNEFNLANMIERDLQVNLYCKMLDEMTEPDEEVAGVLYNIIRRPQLRRKKNETMAVFLKRIAADVMARPEHYFVRLEVPLPKEQRERFDAQLIRRIEAVKRFFGDEHEMKDDIENSSQCHGVYGACTYLGYCSSGCTNLSGLNIRTNLFAELGEQNQGK